MEVGAIMNALRQLIIAAAVFAATAAFAVTARADVLELKIDDQISPASAEVIISAIDQAERVNASVLIITLNTPGGLDTSMREIISRMDSSRVPIVVYVAPSGARGASGVGRRARDGQDDGREDCQRRRGVSSKPRRKSRSRCTGCGVRDTREQVVHRTRSARQP